MCAPTKSLRDTSMNSGDSKNPSLKYIPQIKRAIEISALLSLQFAVVGIEGRSGLELHG
jgi:hypothetical protein